MKKLATLLLIGASFAVSAHSALAADIIEPPVIEAPAPVVVQSVGGWYIRGDIDYGALRTKGIDYDVLTSIKSFDSAKLKGSFSLGGGIGYQFTDHFRADLTLNHHFKAGFRGSTSGACLETADGGVTSTLTGSCVSSDIASVSIYTLLANAYADLGNYNGFTPYVGAGIGGAHVAWSDLTNTATCTPSVAVNQCSDGAGGWGTAGGAVTQTSYTHKGISGMRFAYALHAGFSYDLMANLKLDTGYSWTHINGGDMFRYKGMAPGHIDDTGVMGRDRGIDIHEVRVGLRYQFGGATRSFDSGGYAEPAVYK